MSAAFATLRTASALASAMSEDFARALVEEIAKIEKEGFGVLEIEFKSGTPILLRTTTSRWPDREPQAQVWSPPQ